jgi:hypothetical protein
VREEPGSFDQSWEMGDIPDLMIQSPRGRFQSRQAVVIRDEFQRYDVEKLPYIVTTW